MDAQFWIDAWNEGRTGFHQESYHAMLLKFFPDFHPEAGQKVLVPLCGKTKDLIWLHNLGLNVHGVELHAQAVKDFFTDNNLADVETEKSSHFDNFKFRDLTISNGDFFKLSAKDTYDLVYDRASLVALPARMRTQYAQVVTEALKNGGKYLLIVYEYDQSKLDGPPFSISEKEIESLYGSNFGIKPLDTETVDTKNSKFEVLDGGFKQRVYSLTKIKD